MYNNPYPKNMLVIYQGGGYDGCIWEYNAFFWDADREFVQIVTSGSMGIKTPEAGYEMYRAIKSGAETGSNYRLTCKTHMRELNEEYASPIVVKCLEVINKHYQCFFRDHPVLDRLEAHLLCSKCSSIIDVGYEQINMVNTVSATGRCSGPFYKTERLCEDCFNNGLCRVCERDAYDEDRGYCGSENLDENGYCEEHRCFVLLQALNEARVWPCDETKKLLEAYRHACRDERCADEPYEINDRLYAAMSDHYKEHGTTHVHAYAFGNAPGQLQLQL